MTMTMFELFPEFYQSNARIVSAPRFGNATIGGRH